MASAMMQILLKLKIAKTLGLTITPALLARAGEVTD